MLPLQFDDLAEELHPEQRRFPALPGERDFRNILPFDVLPHVGLENLVGHFEILVGWEQLLFLEVEAVFAVEIADRPDGLGHDVEGPHQLGPSGFLRLRVLLHQCSQDVGEGSDRQAGSAPVKFSTARGGCRAGR